MAGIITGLIGYLNPEAAPAPPPPSLPSPAPGPRAEAGTILGRRRRRRTSTRVNGEEKARALDERRKALDERRKKETPKRISEDPSLWPHDPPCWVGLKCLGQGSFGIATLWEYVGDGSPEDEACAYFGKKIVIKSGLNHKTTAALFEEGRIMKWLADRGDSHLTRLVYNTHEGYFDKLYLEYCVFGDLSTEFRARCRERRPYSEVELWKMFFCLAKAARTMGMTDSHGILIHMDMKPANTLIQEAGRPDHDCRGGFVQYKIADFGLAFEDNIPSLLSFKLWKPAAIGRGTLLYKAPEQWFRDLEFGEKLNVWGVGTIMFQALLLEHKPPPGPRPVVDGIRQHISYDKFKSPFGADLIPALGKGYKYGKDLEKAKEANNYSVSLRATILHCLMHDPSYRSSSEDLFNRIGASIQSLYGVKDDEYEASATEERRKEEEELELEKSSQTLSAREAYDEKSAYIQEIEQRKSQKKREETKITEEKEKAAAAARERERKENPPPLWKVFQLAKSDSTSDSNPKYWINTETGFSTRDDPFEKPPTSRANRRGQVRPLLEISPLEQTWEEEYEVDQGGQWRRVWTRKIWTGRGHTKEVKHTEPGLHMEWRLWHRDYCKLVHGGQNVILGPQPGREYQNAAVVVVDESGTQGWKQHSQPTEVVEKTQPQHGWWELL